MARRQRNLMPPPAGEGEYEFEVVQPGPPTYFTPSPAVKARGGLIPVGDGEGLAARPAPPDRQQTGPTKQISGVLGPLVTALGDCLTPESARRLLALKVDSRLQARIADLAERHNEGELSDEELEEYRDYVSFGEFVAILKAQARLLLAQSSDQ